MCEVESEYLGEATENRVIVICSCSAATNHHVDYIRDKLRQEGFSEIVSPPKIITFSLDISTISQRRNGSRQVADSGQYMCPLRKIAITLGGWKYIKLIGTNKKVEEDQSTPQVRNPH